MRTLQLITVLGVLTLGLGAWAKNSVPTLTEIPMKWVPTLKPDIILSNGFKPHRGFKGTGYRIEPIHRNQGPLDYIAWHDESWDDLRVLYGRAWDWPREMSEAQNADDLETKHYAKFLTLDWITYEVLSLDGERALGSIYITPQECGGHGAHAMYWITTPLRADIEATFHAEIKQWLNTVWPWGTTYFPGPEVTDQERGRLYRLMERGICP
jgi:hypothetical protein